MVVRSGDGVRGRVGGRVGGEKRGWCEREGWWEDQV